MDTGKTDHFVAEREVIRLKSQIAAYKTEKKYWKSRAVKAEKELKASVSGTGENDAST